MELTDTGLRGYVQNWNPDPVVDEDALTVGPVATMSALLNRSGPVVASGEPLPPLWHWFYFLRPTRHDELGVDGHPSRGPFLPPIPHRQRMFAGGRCDVMKPLQLGETTVHTSALADVSLKHGKSGELLFVTERHEFRQQNRLCVLEERDLVYRSGHSAARHPTAMSSTALEQRTPWHLAAQPDPTLLFRFSALTANPHRIHYDLPYAQDVEGYPDLVVHGPLLVLLMLELPRRNTPRPVQSVSYRLRSPVFAKEALTARGVPTDTGAELDVATHRDERHATAEVTFA